MLLVAVCLFDIPTSQKSTWNTESKRQKNCSSISECGMFCLFLDVDVQLLFHTRLSFINRKIACRYSKWLPEENKYYDGNRIWRMINVVWNWVPKIFCLAHHSIDHNLNYTMFGKKKKIIIVVVILRCEVISPSRHSRTVYLSSHAASIFSNLNIFENGDPADSDIFSCIINNNKIYIIYRRRL